MQGAIAYHDWGKLLSRYAGSYALTANFDFMFKVENGRLVAYPQPNVPSPLYAKSETTFFPLYADAEIEFVVNAQCQTEYLHLHRDGDSRKAMRK
jgi:hypothetical protein